MQNARYRVLLIEDDTLDQMAFTRFVNDAELPYDCTVAGSIADAKSTLAAREFDVVVSDYSLGDGILFDVLGLIRNTPIIVTTGAGDEEIAVKAMKAGASDYLIKDFQRHYLKTLPVTVENAVRHSRNEEKLRLLSSAVTSTHDSVYITDMKGRIIFVNRAFCETYGYTEHEIIGNNYGILCKEGSIAAGLLRGCHADGERKGDFVHQGEFVHQRKDGTEFPVSLTRSVIKNADSNPLAIVAVARDITERKNAEQQLKKYRDNLEALVAERTDQLATEKELLSVTLSSMSDGIIVVNAEKRIILINKVTEKLTGWKFEEAHGKLVHEVLNCINERTKAPAKSPIDKALASGNTEAGTNRDAIIDRTGLERPISAAASPICKEDGSIFGSVCVIRDVAREREIDRMKTDFVSSVSHELRTPLTSIKAYTGTILRDPNMPENTKREFLLTIDEESDRLAKLIEQLLEISRLEAGTVRIATEPVDIAAVTSKALPELQPLADKKNIHLKTDIDTDLPRLRADPAKIESLITNLIDNAIKFTPEQGKVSLSAQCCDEQLVIRVSDTGMGIPKEDLPKIFDRFYRVHRPGKQIKGTGLGLAIVQQIVAMHNGRIEVESLPGQGTTFTVFLPLPAPAPLIPIFDS